MFITVTDKGMPPHIYESKCKCRGCVAVKKATNRAWLKASSVILIGAPMLGFAGAAFGPYVGLAIVFLVPGVFMAFSPNSEVLKPDKDVTE